ncbi:recombinase family protein [Robinsoniella sp. KNHs210]|uniref:recombinase family protein n=1 Tax=Robinsoniella sp. KNHs210 TaxID=1469950 RepID=UPI0009DF79C5|nr:recombinase family protein [Robinsoniella sp. KNHs210]
MLKHALGLRTGDTLIITSLDRLSRNKEDIKHELLWFQQKGIRLKILDLPTSMIEIPPGQSWILEMIQNILTEVLSSIAEQERLTIRKRQQEGIEAAKTKGKHLGRHRINEPNNFEEVYQQWKSGVCTAKEAMLNVEMKRSSFYRMVKTYEKKVAQKVSGIDP